MQIAPYRIGASVITNYTVRGWDCGRMHGNVARRHAGLPTLPIFAEASRFWGPYYDCTIANSRFFTRE